MYGDTEQVKKALVTEALKIHEEQIKSDKILSRLGAWLINEGDTILTHCNAGAWLPGLWHRPGRD